MQRLSRALSDLLLHQSQFFLLLIVWTSPVVLIIVMPWSGSTLFTINTKSSNFGMPEILCYPIVQVLQFTSFLMKVKLPRSYFFFFQIYRQQCVVDKHMVQWSSATLFERDFPLQKNPWCNSCLTFIIYIFIFNTSVSLAICPPLYLLMPLAVQVLALPLPRVPIQFEYQMLCLISPLYYCPRKTASDWCRQQTVHRFGVKIPTVASVQSTGEDACN